MVTAKSVMPAAQMVSTLANNMVLRRPMRSKIIPIRIRPKPLQIDKTPTKVTARDSAAFTDKARSFAKLITELPTAARKDRQVNAIQKEARRSI